MLFTTVTRKTQLSVCVSEDNLMCGVCGKMVVWYGTVWLNGGGCWCFRLFFKRTLQEHNTSYQRANEG